MKRQDSERGFMKRQETVVQLLLEGEAASDAHKSKVCQIGESPITRFGRTYLTN